MTKSKRKCERCGERFQPPVHGRPARFCGPSCRQAAYLERREDSIARHARLQNDPHGPAARALSRDLNHMLARAAIRREIWGILRQIGFVNDPDPPSPSDPPRTEILNTLRRAGLGDLLPP